MRIEKVVEKRVRVLHGTAAFPIAVLPDADAKRRLATRDRLAGRVVLVALGYGQGRVLLAQLVDGRAHVRAATTTGGKAKGALGRGEEAAGLAAHAAASALLVCRTAVVLPGRRTPISVALLATRCLVVGPDGSNGNGLGDGRGRGGLAVGGSLVVVFGIQ